MDPMFWNFLAGPIILGIQASRGGRSFSSGTACPAQRPVIVCTDPSQKQLATTLNPSLCAQLAAHSLWV